MMNEARLGVGVRGLALSEVAYQNAAAYAKDRLQGRAISRRQISDKAADPIIVHPDVRRVLMSIRAFNEGSARAGRVDRAKERCRPSFGRRKGAPERRRSHGSADAGDQGCLTDGGFANAVMAQQIYGGHGYIAEHGMEQFVRDARIAQIYEGANGIQALDLVGRKLRRMVAARITGFLRRGRRPISRRCRQRRYESLFGPLGQSLAPSAGGVDVVHAERTSPSRTMPALGRTTTCISSGSWRSAICGAGSPKPHSPSCASASGSSRAH